uniref:Uncharacterized protein n=1 Tax=Strigamia maritima TaxID=126957 RepID=T1JJD2_STRMM
MNSRLFRAVAPAKFSSLCASVWRGSNGMGNQVYCDWINLGRELKCVALFLIDALHLWKNREFYVARLCNTGVHGVHLNQLAVLEEVHDFNLVGEDYWNIIARDTDLNNNNEYSWEINIIIIYTQEKHLF